MIMIPCIYVQCVTVDHDYDHITCITLVHYIMCHLFG